MNQEEDPITRKNKLKIFCENMEKIYFARTMEFVVLQIRTERLILRQWESGDLAPFAALNADPRVMEYFPFP